MSKCVCTREEYYEDGCCCGARDKEQPVHHRRATCTKCGAKWVTAHEDAGNVECPKCKSKRVQVRALAILGTERSER